MLRKACLPSKSLIWKINASYRHQTPGSQVDSHGIFKHHCLATVIREDVALFSAQRIDLLKLAQTGRAISALLDLLWVTGLILLVIDVGFYLTAVAAKPKLAAKLTGVCLLTANGALLHWLAFP